MARVGMGRSGWVVALVAVVVLGCGGGSSPAFGDDDAGAAAGGSGGAGADASTDAGAVCVGGCDDGISCTVDTCTAGACSHLIGPATGATACPSGQFCEIGAGCQSLVACATKADCVKHWSDACHANVACDPARSVCTFTTLDKDSDGHPPIVCGGDDCNDVSPQVYPGRAEACDGLDNDCNLATDDGATCPGLAVCAQGSCACPPDSQCGGACVDKSSDEQNCGACGNRCPTGSACNAGTCSCPVAGQVACSGACVDTRSDPANCAGCGNACASGYACQSSACLCLGSSCGGVCFDTQRDPSHCGGCSTVCASGQSCLSGVCKCPASSQACGGVCTDVTSNAAHCGTCDTVCALGASCTASQCVCPAGKQVCSGACTDVSSDKYNCGACGSYCPGLCSGNACLPTCSDGVKNAAETDIDCGGSACAPCASGKFCLVGGDCMGNTCTVGKCAGAATISFASAGTVTVGSIPYSVALGDFDKNGKLDLFSANDGATTASAALNLGNMTFGAAATYTAGSAPFHVVLGDVSGDGLLDAVVTNSASSNVSIFRGVAGGTFAAATNVTVGVGVTLYASALGDLDGDGDLDLAVAGESNGFVYLLHNNGAGAFTSFTSYPVTTPSHLLVADLTGDHVNDIIVTSGTTSTGSTFTVLKGLAGGLFQVQTGSPQTTGSGPRSLAVADFDGDGDLDVAVACYVSSRVYVHLNGGAGVVGNGSSFTSTNYATGAGTRWVVAADFNRDGLPDLAVANYSGLSVSVLAGAGGGVFGAAVTSPLATGGTPEALASGDLDGDGLPDLVVADGGNSLAVLRNTTQ